MKNLFLWQDANSLFCSRWIFLRVPEIQWRRRSSHFMTTKRCCRLHTSPVSFYAFSLYRFYHSRRHTAFFPRCIPTSFFSLFLIRSAKRLPQMIRFIIRFVPYVRSLHACILTVDKARKEILHLTTKVATDRSTHQHYFVSFCSQFFIFLRFFRTLGFINIWNSVEIILIYNYFFIALL